MASHSLPRHLNVDAALKLLASVRDDQDSSVSIDFGNLQYAESSAALLLATELKTIRKRRPNDFFDAPNSGLEIEAHGYLKHIGFFRHLGLSIGKAPGQASGSDAYLPITIVDIRKLRSYWPTVSDRPVGKLVDSEAERLAKILTQSNSIKIWRPISYCLREVIRNVFEHAQTHTCAVAAQRYGGSIEIAIADTGIGILGSLGQAFEDLKNDDDALEMALRPGISRISAAEAGDNEWGNSGFGLYVLSELGRRTGSFALLSGRGYVKLPLPKGAAAVPSEFTGTFLRLEVEKPKGKNFETFIREIIEEGERKAAISPFPRRASKSTRSV